MATIMVNGQIFSGKSVQVSNGKVFIDGEEYVGADDEKKIEIHVAGDVDEIDVDVCHKIVVAGNVGSIQTSSGDVKCGDVGGKVKTNSGDIKYRK